MKSNYSRPSSESEAFAYAFSFYCEFSLSASISASSLSALSLSSPWTESDLAGYCCEPALLFSSSSGLLSSSSSSSSEDESSSDSSSSYFTSFWASAAILLVTWSWRLVSISISWLRISKRTGPKLAGKSMHYSMRDRPIMKSLFSYSCLKCSLLLKSS